MTSATDPNAHHLAVNTRRARRRRWLRVTLLVLAALLVVPIVFVEMAPGPRPSVEVPEVAAARPLHVFVADWGYHTSITVEQPPGWRLGPQGDEAAPLVEYAWGDRRFYMESNFWPHAVFATLFLPTESVTYVHGREQPPRVGRGPRAVYEREVSANELRTLVADLEASIRRPPNGPRSAPFPAVPGYAGRFYPGVGAYLWWTNCNRWTVERLQAAGLADSGRGVVLAGQVAGRLRGFGPVARGARTGRFPRPTSALQTDVRSTASTAA